jgi:hypothetical protein
MSELSQVKEPVKLAQLGYNTALVKEIQTKLGNIGLLDPPPDGIFGSVSSWALSEFAKKVGITYQNGLTPELAQAIENTTGIYEYHKSDDLAGKITEAIIRNGAWVCLHPECFNIVYIEGMNMNGLANPNKPNQFNDLRLIIQVKEGTPKLVDMWDATTTPGKYWVQHRMNPAGAAMIAFGQYKAWRVGVHHAGSASAHEALVQVSDLNVYRDDNENFKRDDGKLYTGIFGINQHWGYDYPKDDLGRSSAGCLVGRTKKGHKEFMSIVKSDPRYKVNHGYKFITTILPAADII